MLEIPAQSTSITCWSDGALLSFQLAGPQGFGYLTSRKRLEPLSPKEVENVVQNGNKEVFISASATEAFNKNHQKFIARRGPRESWNFSS